MITGKDRQAKAGEIYLTDFARRAGVTPHTVRYYTRVGLLKPQRNPRSRYKTFNGSDLVRIRFILRARRLGFTLRDIKEIFHRSEQGKTPCPLVREIIRRRIERVTEDLDDITALRNRMRMAVARWDRMPDRLPDGDSICALIEAAD